MRMRFWEVPLCGWGSERELKITFSRFTREICIFEKNFRLAKIFFIKFSIKMVIMKIFVAIILAKLQHFESRASHRSGNLQPEADSRSPPVCSKLMSYLKFVLDLTLYTPQTM